MRVLLAPVLLGVASAARTAGEVVHFGFPYQECSVDSKFTDDLAGTDAATERTLMPGNGVGCLDREYGPHLGAALNLSLISGGGEYGMKSASSRSFTDQLTDGFTLELWLKPETNRSNENTVIVSFSAKAPPASTNTAGMQVNCEKAEGNADPNANDRVSFQLIQKPSGCLVFHVKLIDNAKSTCADLNLGDPGVDSTGTMYATHMLPSLEDCESVTVTNTATGKPGVYTYNAAMPGLDLATPKLQHVVVTMSSYLGGKQTSSDPGTDRGGQNNVPRFAIYVDNQTKTDEKVGSPYENDDGDNAIRYHIHRTIRYGMQDSNEISSLLTNKTQNFVPSSVWTGDHALYVGHDGTSTVGPSSRWEGEVLMLAMYPKPLTAAEISANFGAKLDNTAPFARDFSSSVPEGTCEVLSSFANHAGDWDNDAANEYPSLGAGQTQTLTYSVDPTELSPGRGSLFSDSACSTPLPAGDVSTIYFKPDGHEFSTGDPAWAREPPPAAVTGVTPVGQDGDYAVLPYTVSDGEKNHSAYMYINVSAVNDAPVAGDSQTNVYMQLATDVYINATDLDGENETALLQNCRIKLVTAPTNGNLYIRQRLFGVLQPQNDAYLLPAGGMSMLQVGDDGLDGVIVWYKSNAFPAEQTNGVSVIATDTFTYKIIDADGAESTNTGTGTVTILSGLQAEMEPSLSCKARPDITPCTWMVDEEVLSVVELRGLSQTSNDPSFVVTALPAQGTLYQYTGLTEVDENGNTVPSMGAPITQVDTVVTDPEFLGDYASKIGNVSAAGCVATSANGAACTVTKWYTPGWYYARVLYKGNLNYFNWPEVNPYTDAPKQSLNVTMESFSYKVSTSTESSSSATVHMRVRNVNDPPVLTVPANITFYGAEDTKHFESAPNKIIIDDPDRGLGFYRVVASTSSSLAYLTETVHEQQSTQSISFDKWQGYGDIGNVVAELIGYCPRAVCERSSSAIGCDSGTSCLQSNGGASRYKKIMATPLVVESFFQDVSFRRDGGSVGSQATLTFTVEDWDDGEGPQGGEIGYDGNGNDWGANPEVGATCSGATCGPCQAPNCYSSTAQVVMIRGDLADAGGSNSGTSDEQFGAGDSIPSWFGGAAMFLICFGACCTEWGRNRKRSAKYNQFGRKTPREQRTRDMRIIVPAEAVMCFGLTIILFIVRSGGSPLQFFRMDLYGDGECSDEIEERHQNDTTYVDNGACIAGIPEGYMQSHSMLPGLLFGVFAPLAILEVAGRPNGRLLVGAVALAWFILDIIISSLFKAWAKQIPEFPWIINETDGSISLGKQWEYAGPDGELVEQLERRPQQSNTAFGIFFIIFFFPFLIMCTVAGATCYVKMAPAEEESSSDDSEDERQKQKAKKKAKKKKKKGGKSDRKEKDGKKKDKDKKAKRRKDDDSDGGDDSDDSDSDVEKPAARKKKPAPPPKKDKPPPPSKGTPRKPPPPKTPPAPQITFHAESEYERPAAPASINIEVLTDETEWFYMDPSNQQMGPVTAAGMKQMYDDGELHASTYVWCEDMDVWKELKDAPLHL